MNNLFDSILQQIPEALVNLNFDSETVHRFAAMTVDDYKMAGVFDILDLQWFLKVDLVIQPRVADKIVLISTQLVINANK